MALSIQVVESKPRQYVVSPIGSLDSGTAASLEKQIDSLIAVGGALIVTLDLAALEFISSMGIRVVFKAKKDLAKGGGSLFIAHVPPPIRKSMEVILDMIEEEEAVRRFGYPEETDGAAPDSLAAPRGAPDRAELSSVGLGALLERAEQAWAGRPRRGTALIDHINDPELSAAKPDPVLPVRFERGGGGAAANVAVGRFCETLVPFLEWLIFTDATSVRVGAGSDAAGTYVEIRAAGRMPDDSSLVRNKLLRSFARRFAQAGFNLEIEPEHFRLVPGEAGSAAG